MERRTLLEIVNSCMDSMDLDQVSSISDTPESEQVSRIIRDEYFKLAAEYEWDHVITVDQLEGVGDSNYPTTMKIPATVGQVLHIKYDKTKSGETHKTIDDVYFYPNPQDFIDKVYTRNTDNSNIDEINEYVEGIPIFIVNDNAPSYCTTFDGTYIVFDSYDSAVDTTLHQSKSVIIGIRAEAWSTSDAAYPDLPVRMFPMFVSKCKLVTNETIRQVSLRSERRDFLNLYHQMKREKRVQVPNRKPNYGRRR